MDYATAIGYKTKASYYYSTAMGFYTEASGQYSTAMGANTRAENWASTAMGYSTKASGHTSTATGYGTEAGGDYSFAGGMFMKLTGNADHTFVWGYSQEALAPISTPNAFLIFPAGTIGRVGIGTPSPGSMLHVKGNGWPESFLFLDTHGDNQDSGIRFYENNSVKGHLYHQAGVNKPGVLRFEYWGTTQLALHENGNVGIGETNPSYKLHVNGAVAGTSWNNISSRGYKENIQKVDKADYPLMLAKLVNMEPTTYKYKKEYGGDGETKLGFIAEDMPQEVLSKDGKGVDLYELLTLTIGAIKGQQWEVDQLKAENDALRKEIQQIKALIGI